MEEFLELISTLPDGFVRNCKTTKELYDHLALLMNKGNTVAEDLSIWLELDVITDMDINYIISNWNAIYNSLSRDGLGVTIKNYDAYKQMIKEGILLYRELRQ